MLIWGHMGQFILPTDTLPWRQDYFLFLIDEKIKAESGQLNMYF